MSGICAIFKKGSSLTCVMGDEEICYITQEESRDVETIRQKIRGALT